MKKLLAGTPASGFSHDQTYCLYGLLPNHKDVGNF